MKRSPFFLRPTGKDYLWGGNRLREEFGKDLDLQPLAETWECSTHPDGSCFAAGGDFQGQSLAQILKTHPEFLGTHPDSGEGLPILIKFIDARQDLSVQVHPDDAYAAAHENGQRGKTEFWYVLDAAEDTRLVYGLNRDVTEAALRAAIDRGDLKKYLQTVPVKKDDLFFIEPGTIHAIGAGALVAEIQESSNLTYRLYDYDRVDKDGKKRPLHLDKALIVANLKSSAEPRQPMRVLRYRPGCATELLCRCRYFEVHRMLVSTGKQPVFYRADEVSYRVLLCVEGRGTVDFAGQSHSITRGDCLFFPADSQEVAVSGKLQLLDIRG